MSETDSLPCRLVEVKVEEYLGDRWRQTEIEAEVFPDLPMAIVSLSIQAHENEESFDGDHITYYLIVGPRDEGNLPMRLGIKNPDEGWFMDLATFTAYDLEPIDDGDDEPGDVIGDALYEGGDALVSALTDTKGHWLEIRKAVHDGDPPPPRIGHRLSLITGTSEGQGPT